MEHHQVYVFGCGPAGLVTAQAAADLGFAVTVLSRRVKSPLWGCQYLHEPIPGVPAADPVKVLYTLEGSIDGYRTKVYGPDYQGAVSPEDLENTHWAYDLRATYNALWDMWEDRIVDVPVINGEHAQHFIPDLTCTGTVFSTIPRHVMCRDRQHRFEVQQVWAMGDSDQQRIPIRPPQANTIVCNGLHDVGWYRVSDVFDYGTIEWPWRNGKRPPFTGVVPVDKPISTTCNCLPDVHYVGRYGKWEKGYLVHEAYAETVSVLTNLQGALF
jgi:hypothetical protein